MPRTKAEIENDINSYKNAMAFRVAALKKYNYNSSEMGELLKRHNKDKERIQELEQELKEAMH